MAWVAVKSRAIRAIDYDKESLELEIMFAQGNSYTYYNVPPQVVAGLLGANSKGQFYNNFIKDRY